MHAILNFVEYIVQGLLQLALFVVIAYAILSWLIAFNVVNTRNRAVWQISRVLEAIAGFRDATMVNCTSSDSMRFDALALRKGGLTRLLVANYQPEPRMIAINGMPGGAFSMTLAPYAVESIDRGE